MSRTLFPWKKGLGKGLYMTDKDLAELNGALSRYTHSYKKRSDLKRGDATFEKGRDTFKLSYRRVSATGKGMIAYSNGNIESSSEELVIVVNAGPRMR